jgi:TolC family type I secretion outer membrane protein
MKKRQSLMLAGAAVILAAHPFGQLASATSLDDALALAYGTNPTLDAERAQVRVTDENVPQALSGWRPTVKATAQASHDWVNGLQQQQKSQPDVDFSPRSYGLTVTQPVFRGFRTVKGTSQAENQVQAERQRLTSTEQDTLFKAVQAYMAVVRDQSVLELNQNNVKVLQAQLESTQDQFQVGELTRTDVAQAKSSLQGAIASQIQAEGNLKTSLATYREVVGAEPVDLKMPAPHLQLPATKDEAVAQARSVPTVTAAQFEQKAAKDQIDVAFGQMLPEVSIQGSFQRNENQSFGQTNYNEGVIMGLVTIPLYQAGNVDSQVRQSKQQYYRSKLLVDEALRSAEQQAIAAWQTLDTANAQISAFEEQVKAAKVALDGIRQEQQVGARTIIDVLDQEQSYLNAEVSLVGAQTDQVVAQYQVLGAVGRLTARDLKLKTDLYDPTKHYNEVRNKFIGIGGSVQ